MCSAVYEEVIGSPDWVVEPKMDGHRCLTWLRPTGVACYTRKNFPMPRAASALRGARSPSPHVLDGEWYEDTYHVFDIYHGTTLRDRYAVMEEVVAGLAERFPIRVVPRWEKATAYAEAMRLGLEGVVFKHLNHHYNFTNRQSPTPSWLKVKP